MNKTILKNGITLITEKKKTDSVTILVSVKVGSNYEPLNLNGISHFIEHMLFEGTKKRKDAKEIANEIESLGGEINAYTSNERTSYYIKALKKHFDEALGILSDMVINPLFENKKLEKERKVILREIDMCNDDPRAYKWALFYKNLFEKHPAKHPVIGRKEVIENVSREDLVNYYKAHYLANNTVISVVGDIGNVRHKIENKFRHLPKGLVQEYPEVYEPKQSKPKIVVEKRKTESSYMVLGYKTVNRLHHDSYVLDVIKSILGRGQSGIIVDEVRNKRGLAYEIGIYHEPTVDYGVFAVHLNLSKSKIGLAKSLILKEFRRLQHLSDKELKDAKGYIEGQFLLGQEDTHEHADSLCFWELIKDANYANDYVGKINHVARQDVMRVAKKYLNNNYTMVLIKEK